MISSSDCFCNLSLGLSDLTGASDSEWVTVKDDEGNESTTPVSTTIAFEGFKPYIYINKIYEPEIGRLARTWGLVSGCVVRFTEFGDNLVKRTLDDLGVSPKTPINFLMFYSPKDLEYAFGFDNINPLYLDGSITQKRNIKGYKLDLGNKTTIYDLKGWASESLAKLAEAVGLKMKNKESMDEYKTRMDRGLIEKTHEFLDYALDDVMVLFSIQTNFTKLVGDVCEFLDVDPPAKLPGTVGALVAKVFEEFILSRHPDPLKFQFALCKLGLLDSSHKDYRQLVTNYNNVTDEVETMADVLAIQSRTTIDEIKKTTRRSRENRAKDLEVFLDPSYYESLAYSQSTVKHLAKLPDTAAFLALVQGGRCNNERPYEYRAEFGADIDALSAYGSTLRSFDYPVGLPTTWSFRSNQRRPRLRDMVKILDNPLSLIVVQGTLNFDQDLIYSKIVTLDQIHKTAYGDFDKETNDDDRDDDISHIPGDYALMRREIINGIVTPDVFKALSAVATDQEKCQLLDLEVVAAQAYLEQDRVTDIDEWTDIVLADKGGWNNRDGRSSYSVDNRTRKWYSLPLESFIGRLVDERGRLKGLGDEYKSKEQIFKLFINTLYGDLASPFFSVGNTLVANLITARCRLGVWMLAKPLLVRQLITDGGMYEPWHVAYFAKKGKLPGLNKLSDTRNWLDTKNYTRKYKSLGDRDWKQIITDLKEKPEDRKRVAKELDQLALEHVNEFWSRYGLSLPFQLEHKADNFFLTAAYWNKGHYAFDTVTGKRLFKIRGAKDFNDEDLKRSPVYELLSNILDGRDDFPQNLEYDHFYLLKIGKYQQAQNSKGFANLDNKRPGDQVIESRVARFNNAHFPITDLAEYKRLTGRKTHHRKTRVNYFEKYKDKGIKFIHQKMINNEL